MPASRTVWAADCDPGDKAAERGSRSLPVSQRRPVTRAYVPGHQIAGKTGTTQNNYSATFVGYTPRYAASVMVLNPRENQDVGGYGGGRPATIWNDAMTPILQATPMAAFSSAERGMQ